MLFESDIPTDIGRYRAVSDKVWTAKNRSSRQRNNKNKCRKKLQKKFTNKITQINATQLYLFH